MLWYLADLCFDGMSVNVWYHIYNFEFVYESMNFFLPNDHIWNYRNLNSHISQTHQDILIQIFRIFYTYWLLSSDRWMKAEMVKVPKFAFSIVGLLIITHCINKPEHDKTNKMTYPGLIIFPQFPVYFTDR